MVAVSPWIAIGSHPAGRFVAVKEKGCIPVGDAEVLML
jgi:hypothetical protein